MSRALYRRGSSEFDRGISFFDVIYGFALTLLVTNIDVPRPQAWQSVRSLLAHGVGIQLLGFLISFVVIVAFWHANHARIARLTGMDSSVITVNIVTVGLVIFIPFTTQGISDPATADLPLPAALYAGNLSLAILSQMVMFELAHRHDLVAQIDPLPARRAEWLDSLTKPMIFVASMPVAYLAGGNAAKWVWLLLVVVGPVSGRISARQIEQARRRAGLV